MNSRWKATAAPRPRGQIVPIEVKVKRRTVVFARDEHVRPNVNLANMVRLRPAFAKQDGTVTAGPPPRDAALVSAQEAQRRGAVVMAWIVAYGHAGAEPSEMGIGPVPVSRIALERTGLKIANLDVIESNEAFAAQACPVSKEFGSTPPESTLTAARSHSAIRSAHRGRRSSSRPCMSWSAPAPATA